MGNTLEHFDPASEGFALVAESLEAAGVSLEPMTHNEHDQKTHRTLKPTASEMEVIATDNSQ